MDKFEVVVVGGGLAGLSAAYCLAKDGVEVLVLERGDYSGAKNVTGGRLYLNPIRHLLPGLFEEAPLERRVTREIISLMGERASVSINLASERFGQKPYHSFTLLRGKFDRWLSEKVIEAGGALVTKNRVDDLIVVDGKVKGIICGQDNISADVVLAADGVTSLMAEKAGLRSVRKPQDYAVSVKEIIELSPHVIEERFNVADGEGAAQTFVGVLTKGMFGGGFLYTNIDSVSLGIVVRVADLMEKQAPIAIYDLFEEFKHRPEINALIGGGESVEYSAHLIPEGGIAAVPKLYSDGFLVAGDAAGLALNIGLTVRGMDFAIASGVLAAKAISSAKKADDFSKQSLRNYENLLKESFVLKDLKTFSNAPRFLDNPRLFTLYPQTACDLLEELMFIGDKPKRKLSSTAFGEIRRKVGFSIFKDVFGAFKI